MKKILILLLIVSASLTAYGQRGLHIDQLFQGRIIPQERMVETKVRGKMVAKYQLSYFHSLRFEATASEVKRIEELLDKDRQTSYQRVESKKALTIMLQLQPQASLNRYLCFKRTGNGKHMQVVVIYMEGTLSSLDKMNEILK